MLFLYDLVFILCVRFIYLIPTRNTMNPIKSNLFKPTLKLGENEYIIATRGLGSVEVLGPNPPNLTCCLSLLMVIDYYKYVQIINHIF